MSTSSSSNNVKVVLIGNPGSGKTRLVRELFSLPHPGYAPTLGVEVHPYQTPSKCYNIWDTAGQDRFRGMPDSYYTQADIVVLVAGDGMPLTHQAPKSAEQWRDEALRVVSPHTSFHIINPDLNELRRVLDSSMHG